MNIKQYKKYNLLLLVFLLLAQAQVAFAAQPFAQWLNAIINNVLTMIVWPIFLGLVILTFIWAGILYLTAQGEPSKISQANKAVIYAIVGIIVAIFAFSAVNLIGGIIGQP